MGTGDECFRETEDMHTENACDSDTTFQALRVITLVILTLVNKELIVHIYSQQTDNRKSIVH